MNIDVDEDIKYMFTLRFIPTPNHDIGEVYKPNRPPKPKASIGLSSGIDSHYLLHIIKSNPIFTNTDLQGICIDFKDSRGPKESDVAQQLADAYRIKLKKIVIDNPLKDLETLISVVKEPRYNLYQYYLYKESRDLLVTGDGADEFYLGYTFRYKKYLDHVYETNNWLDKVKLYLTCHENDWVKDQTKIFNKKFKWDLIYNYLRQYFVDLPEYGPASEDEELYRLGPVIAADMHNKLRFDFKPCNAKLAEYCNIDLVTPFIYPTTYIPLLTEMSNAEKYDYEENIGKIPLRKVVGRMDTIKRGFGFDLVGFWLRKGYDMFLKNINKDSFCWEYINKEWFIEHCDSKNIRYVNKFLQIYALEMYLKQLPEIQASEPIEIEVETDK